MDKTKEFELMKKSICIAEKIEFPDRKICLKNTAILTDEEGNILLSCFRGEESIEEHCEKNILRRAVEQNIDLENAELFLTIEPCNTPDEDSCARLIVENGIKKVHIGIKNPGTIMLGDGEEYLKSNGLIVNRYPRKLQDKIYKMNRGFYSSFEDKTLPLDSLFVKKNITELMVEHLKKSGYKISKMPNNWNVDLDYVVAYCNNIEKNNINKRRHILYEALGYAYDEKYAYRDCSDDVRGKYRQWIKEFNDILSELDIDSLKRKKTLIVGCGNGQEGTYLYPNVNDLTIVDIAPESLELAKKRLNPKASYVMSAQDLYEISDNSIEVYISLLTYQSTYFNIEQALLEAYRVLKKQGSLIISIACGFMKNEEIYIDGLKKPKTNEIDRNRPYELISIIRKKLISFDFYSLGVRSTPSEIFIFAKKRNK